jgi:hypothetical protein
MEQSFFLSQRNTLSTSLFPYFSSLPGMHNSLACACCSLGSSTYRLYQLQGMFA